MSELTEASNMGLQQIIKDIQKAVGGIRINQYVKDAAGRIGIVEHIAISPYWHEESAGIMRAYVTGKHENGSTWADWLAFDEMELA